ncbi:MAG: hypothetical protein ACM3ZQ_02610, partial [Bacillota bacterium]
KVSAFTGVSADEIRGRGRSRDIAQSRWLFVYTAAKAGHALMDIARYLDRGGSAITMAMGGIEDSIREHGEWEHRLASFAQASGDE